MIIRKFLRKIGIVNLPKFKSIGLGSEIDSTTKFIVPSNINIGNHVYIGHNCFIHGGGGIDIGDGCVLGPEIVILTVNHNYKQHDMLPYNFENINSPVTIGKGVWIGYGAMLAPGTFIEDGAVVGMGSVVRGHIKKGEIVIGNPSSVIATRKECNIGELIDNDSYFMAKYGGNGKKMRRRNLPE